MARFTAICQWLSNTVLHLARIALAALGVVVIYGVVLRYAFSNSPPYIEQVALLLVISVAMFGAAAGVHDAGHIGLDSLVRVLPRNVRRWCYVIVEILTVVFAVTLLVCSVQMGLSTWHDTIPTLGISEAFRYLPILAAGVLITLFSLEHMLAQFSGHEVVPSWH